MGRKPTRSGSMQSCRVLSFCYTTHLGLTAPTGWDCRTASSACRNKLMRVSTPVNHAVGSLAQMQPPSLCLLLLRTKSGLTSRRFDNYRSPAFLSWRWRLTSSSQRQTPRTARGVTSRPDFSWTPRGRETGWLPQPRIATVPRGFLYLTEPYIGWGALSPSCPFLDSICHHAGRAQPASRRTSFPRRGASRS